MMEKKFIFILSLIFLSFNVVSLGNQVNAAEKIDGSYLLENEDESIGATTQITRGKFLQSGNSRLAKAGDGLVAAGGATMAQMDVEDISIAVELQILKGGKWTTVETWSESKKNTSLVTSSKILEVEPGYYRVKCLHSANSEASSSFTNGLSIS